jgi:hypothetical protein
MKSVQPVKLVLFDGTIEWKYVEGPSKDVKEVEYYKSNNKDYVLRYDGNIKPLFVKEPNIIYYKDYISDNRTYGKSKLQNSIYAKYINSGYEPVYSSIGYNACKSCMDYNWNEIPHVNISEHNITPLINSIEYSWFNNGAAIFITPEIKFTYTNKKLSNNTYKQVSEIVKEYLSKYYNTSNSELINYIFNKYNIENNWEYYSDTNIDDYIYTITLTMK